MHYKASGNTPAGPCPPSFDPLTPEILDSKAQRMTSRRIVDRQPIPEFPGWELRTVELTIPPGTQTQHTHPRVGINYIVKGELHTKFVGKELEKVKQGDGFLDLPDLVHEVRRSARPRAQESSSKPGDPQPRDGEYRHCGELRDQGGPAQCRAPETVIWLCPHEG